MKTFKVWIKDPAKQNKLELLQKALGMFVQNMTTHEQYKFFIAYHLMDYKLLLHKINKRLNEYRIK